MVVCSAIIYYNCLIVENLVYKGKISKEEFEELGRFSPYAWEHIDLYGTYDFGVQGVKEIEKNFKK